MALAEPKKGKKKEKPVKNEEFKFKSKTEKELKKEPPKKNVFSIWTLLMQSKIHRDALVQVLYERKVSTNTTPK